MRYFRFTRASGYRDCITETVTVSEDEIINQYWNFWRRKMIEKHGQEKVDAKYGRAHCIRDWCKINNAWLVENCQAD